MSGTFAFSFCIKVGDLVWGCIGMSFSFVALKLSFVLVFGHLDRCCSYVMLNLKLFVTSVPICVLWFSELVLYCLYIPLAIGLWW